MARFTKTTLLAAIAFGTTMVAAQAVFAGGGCSRGGGGCHRAPSHSYRQPVYRAPNYYQPQPTYRQPAYQPPAFQQPAFQQPVGGAPLQQQIQQPAPTNPQAQGRPMLRSNVNPGQTQAAPAQSTPGNFSAAPNGTQNATAAAPAFAAQTPAAQSPAAQSPAATAQMSALQALGGFAPPAEAAPAPAPAAPTQPQQAAEVGNWTATLTNGSTVQLVLQNGGAFSWSATNKSGKSSSFQGTYATGNGTLTLLRSADNQKLAGAMTSTGGNAFSFKLNGSSNAATLNFTRG